MFATIKTQVRGHLIAVFVCVCAAPVLLLILLISLYLGTQQMLAFVQLKKQLSDFKIRGGPPETGEGLLCEFMRFALEPRVKSPGRATWISSRRCGKSSAVL